MLAGSLKVCDLSIYQFQFFPVKRLSGKPRENRLFRKVLDHPVFAGRSRVFQEEVEHFVFLTDAKYVRKHRIHSVIYIAATLLNFIARKFPQRIYPCPERQQGFPPSQQCLRLPPDKISHIALKLIRVSIVDVAMKVSVLVSDGGQFFFQRFHTFIQRCFPISKEQRPVEFFISGYQFCQQRAELAVRNFFHKTGGSQTLLFYRGFLLGRFGGGYRKQDRCHVLTGISILRIRAVTEHILNGIPFQQDLHLVFLCAFHSGGAAIFRALQI